MILMKNIKKENQTFESIKHIDDNNMEFWYARELSVVLEYKEWRNFNKVLERAKIACENSGFDVESDFVEVHKIV